MISSSSCGLVLFCQNSTLCFNNPKLQLHGYIEWTGPGTHFLAICFVMPLEQFGNHRKSHQDMGLDSESCVNITSVAFRHCWQPQQPLNKTLKMTNPSTGSPLIRTHSIKLKFLLNNWRCFLSIKHTPALIIALIGWERNW